jgi:hypothetical protein
LRSRRHWPPPARPGVLTGGRAGRPARYRIGCQLAAAVNRRLLTRSPLRHTL